MTAHLKSGGIAQARKAIAEKGYDGVGHAREEIAAQPADRTDTARRRRFLLDHPLADEEEIGFGLHVRHEVFPYRSISAMRRLNTFMP